MISQTLTVAGIQALPKGYLLNPENVSHAVDLLKEASKLGVDFACFPEAYPALGEEVICDAASEFGLYVIASFLLERGDGLYNNESVLIGPRGEVIGRQRKVHPAPGLEPYAPGGGYNIMQTPWGKVGVLICIDGWGFPEGFHHMSQGGVDLIFNPCLIFRKKPQKKMSLLTRVLDYKLPIIAPNNAFWSFKIFRDDPGMPPEGGQSLILSPPAFQSEDEIKKFMREASSCEGWIIAEAGRDEEILVARIDPQAVKNARSIWTKCFGACTFQ